jgi:hypothetical protein
MIAIAASFIDRRLLRFLDALRAAAASTAPVVLGLRADFYTRCAAEPRLVEPLRNGQLIATPMKTDQVRGVIEQPASKALDQPVWLVMRRPKAAITLGGVRFPAGVEMLFSGSALHRDPDVYPDPLAFDPDRWQGRTARDLPAGAYIPFAPGIGAASGTISRCSSCWSPWPPSGPNGGWKPPGRASRSGSTASSAGWTGCRLPWCLGSGPEPSYIGLGLPSGAVQKPPPT